MQNKRKMKEVILTNLMTVKSKFHATLPSFRAKPPRNRCAIKLNIFLRNTLYFSVQTAAEPIVNIQKFGNKTFFQTEKKTAEKPLAFVGIVLMIF